MDKIVHLPDNDAETKHERQHQDPLHHTNNFSDAALQGLDPEMLRVFGHHHCVTRIGLFFLLCLLFAATLVAAALLVLFPRMLDGMLLLNVGGEGLRFLGAETWVTGGVATGTSDWLTSLSDCARQICGVPQLPQSLVQREGKIAGVLFFLALFSGGFVLLADLLSCVLLVALMGGRCRRSLGRSDLTDRKAYQGVARGLVIGAHRPAVRLESSVGGGQPLTPSPGAFPVRDDAADPLVGWRNPHHPGH